MRWHSGFILLSMEDVHLCFGGDQLAGADLPVDIPINTFFSLITHPSAVALSEVAFAFLHLIWVLP